MIDAVLFVSQLSPSFLDPLHVAVVTIAITRPAGGGELRGLPAVLHDAILSKQSISDSHTSHHSSLRLSQSQLEGRRGPWRITSQRFETSGPRALATSKSNERGGSGAVARQQTSGCCCRAMGLFLGQ